MKQYSVGPNNQFQNRKCIHLKFKRQIYSGFRTKLYWYGLSMQESIEEFARLVAADDPATVKMLNALAKKKLKAQLEELRTNIKKKDIEKPVDEFEAELLYDMIKDKSEDGSNDSEDS